MSTEAYFKHLTSHQKALLQKISLAFTQDFIQKTAVGSQPFDDRFANLFGDFLALHHCISYEPFSKDKFEYTTVSTLLELGYRADKLPRTYKGYDIDFGGKKVSLKTQADKNIKEYEIHISKFMELGSGKWELDALRSSFLAHLTEIDHIWILRCLAKAPKPWLYELVEIPVDLLQKAAGAPLDLMEDSSQDPKPGYCTVRDEKSNILFQLYFDGGSERKLQIKKINKRLCTILATWEFNSIALTG
jgi:hypothetical protein